MGKVKIGDESQLQKYVNDHSLRLTKHQKEIVERTSKLERGVMLGSLDCVQHFQLMLKAMGAKKCLEIGCFTGATTLSLAMALPEDGKIITTDITDEFVFQDLWKEAGVEHKIDLRIGPALDTLESLIANGESATFDFIFIDADKLNNPKYYEKALVLVRKGGLIAIDNVLWHGKVLEDDPEEEATKMFKSLNEFIRDDLRVEISMLACGDGVTFCYKK